MVSLQFKRSGSQVHVDIRRCKQANALSDSAGAPQCCAEMWQRASTTALRLSILQITCKCSFLHVHFFFH